jgi:hypothetical protein
MSDPRVKIKSKEARDLEKFAKGMGHPRSMFVQAESL